MAALSDESLEAISSIVGIEGTGESFSTPFIYGFLEKYVPTLLRSITNFHYKGLHKIPREGPAIFCANHLSNLDPFIKIIAAQRPIHFLAKEGHYQKQPHRFVMISTGQIETFRETGGKDALSRAADVISSGRCLGIFPEGTRSRRAEAPFLQKGKTGIARLAARFPNVPIVPMSFVGTRELMPPGANFPRLWKRVDVMVDDPITFSEWASHADGGSLDDSAINSIMQLGEEDRSNEMRGIFRLFTNQLIETLRKNGAP